MSLNINKSSLFDTFNELQILLSLHIFCSVNIQFNIFENSKFRLEIE
jgi:hypothetical protein